ncbi:hypothetical protein EW146_g2092 [Bondarzewia mesenterica]|uniref:UBC core domain-containing protein n=1 Tax=Bondarzewia mesenterica TaxID=1095465 RepID=A0A4S4M1R7_9AGAM|nr:hypothetical protein EW146_g2092 [Bondarzewia mesenterica]
MAGRKRRSSVISHIDTERSPKRSRREESQLEEDEDDLEAILARIREQEESEALARKLQDEWNSADTTDATGFEMDHNAIVIAEEDEDEDIQVVDGEALAKRQSSEDVKKGNRVSVASSSSSIKTRGRQFAVGQSAQPGPSRSVPLSSPGLNTPPDIRLEQYVDLFTAKRSCSKCGSSLDSPRGFVAYSATLPPPSLISLLHVPCKKCKINHCRGCSTRIACPLSCKGKGVKGVECSVKSCCAEVRAIALFEALGGFDRLYINEREGSDARAKDATARAPKATSASVGRGGTGYGTGGSYGISEGYARGGPTPAITAHNTQAQKLAEHWDEVIVRALTTIRDFLPDPYSDSVQVYDMIPHAAIQHLLSLSQLPELLGSLLRNDSVTDWISRSEVYYAMLSLLRRMADCELTIEVLIDRQWEKSKTCGIEEWMWKDGEIAWERPKPTAPASRTPPLYAHFKKLTRQCEVFLAGAFQLIDGQGNDEVEDTALKGTSLCGDIIVARDDMERAMKVLGKDGSFGTDPEQAADHEHGADDETHITESGEGKKNAKAKVKSKGKERDPAVDMERAYTRDCERLAFKHISLSVPDVDGLRYLNHHYANDLAQTANASRNPKDRLHLVKELAVMATSLPPGVWVRVDEVRNDAIKIMIAGPQGTPYEGGLFEFDCFMPLEYPSRPPLMHLRTTGNGHVGFNPNLYNTGKVCLSLLGTWSGRPEEQWSRNSTLLQVVVSIQSMILIDLPYFNEPGYGQANPNHPASIAYNMSTRMNTVRWAIVDWMNDKHRNGIWADVIASHFTIRKASIRKAIQTWTEAQPHLLGDPLKQFDDGIKVVEKWPQAGQEE